MSDLFKELKYKKDIIKRINTKFADFMLVISYFLLQLTFSLLIYYLININLITKTKMLEHQSFIIVFFLFFIVMLMLFCIVKALKSTIKIKQIVSYLNEDLYSDYKESLITKINAPYFYILKKQELKEKIKTRINFILEDLKGMDSNEQEALAIYYIMNKDSNYYVNHVEKYNYCETELIPFMKKKLKNKQSYTLKEIAFLKR